MKLHLFSYHVNDVGVEGLSEFSLNSDLPHQTFTQLIQRQQAGEGFYLSTCNRIEYLFAAPPEQNIKEVFPGSNARVFTSPENIVRHLLSVALSKDSVVFGESQILGQFKRAYIQALEQGHCGTILAPLLNRVISEAKSIRAAIGLNQLHKSISTVAGAKIIEKFDDSLKQVLFIGSGETNRLLAKYLKKRGDLHFIWTSRGHHRAVEAAAELGGEVLNWDLVSKGVLPQCDVICTATHSKEILIDQVGLLNANPQMLCDLSVPANISQEDCARLGATYLGIDQLNEELSKSQQISSELLEKLEQEIEAAVPRILKEFNLRMSKALFATTVSQSQRIWEEELDTLLTGQLATLNEDQKQVLFEWSRRLVNKINHCQIESLKQHVPQF